MSHLILGGLLSTPAPTAPILGIAFIALFAIVGVMVGPDYDDECARIRRCQRY